MSNTSIYFKSGTSTSISLCGVVETARFVESRNMTSITLVTRAIFVRKDGQPGGIDRKVAVYIDGAFQANAGDVILVSGSLILSELKGTGKYPVRFERVVAEHIENLGASAAPEKVLGLNRAVIIGRVGKVRPIKCASGKAGASLSIAVSRSRNEGEGKTEVTDWHEILLFSRQAENALKYVHTADQLMLIGAVELRPVAVGEAQKNLLRFTPAAFSVLSRKTGNRQADEQTDEAPAAADADSMDPPF